MFGIEQAPACEDEPLRIPVSVGINVAAHTIEDRVIAWNRAVQVQTQNFSLIRIPVGRLHLCLRREILCAVPVAIVRKEVAPLVAAADIQLSVGSEYDPAGAVIGAVRQPRENVNG